MGTSIFGFSNSQNLKHLAQVEANLKTNYADIDPQFTNLEVFFFFFSISGKTPACLMPLNRSLSFSLYNWFFHCKVLLKANYIVLVRDRTHF